MLNLKVWMTKVTEWIRDSHKGKNISSVNLTNINLTGTVGNGMVIGQLNNGTFFVYGRIGVLNFVRTGANPGFSFTLPDFVPTPTSTIGFVIGFRAENPRESIGFTVVANSRTATVTSNETYENCTNGTLTFMLNGIFYVR